MQVNNVGVPETAWSSQKSVNTFTVLFLYQNVVCYRNIQISLSNELSSNLNFKMFCYADSFCFTQILLWKCLKLLIQDQAEQELITWDWRTWWRIMTFYRLLVWNFAGSLMFCSSDIRNSFPFSLKLSIRAT